VVGRETTNVVFDNGGMGECGAQPDENSKGGKGETHAGVVLSDKLLHRGR
jgi:hypothetical protein